MLVVIVTFWQVEEKMPEGVGVIERVSSVLGVPLLPPVLLHSKREREITSETWRLRLEEDSEVVAWAGFVIGKIRV